MNYSAAEEESKDEDNELQICENYEKIIDTAKDMFDSFINDDPALVNSVLQDLGGEEDDSCYPQFKET